jgi:hypothetical protein
MAEIQAASMKLLPPPEGHCRICAVKHEPHLPHNAQSLFYQTRFNMRYKRAGTWADAMAHCDEPMQQLWIMALREKNAYTEPPEGVAPIAEPIDG